MNLSLVKIFAILCVEIILSEEHIVGWLYKGSILQFTHAFYMLFICIIDFSIMYL